MVQAGTRATSGLFLTKMKHNLDQNHIMSLVTLVVTLVVTQVFQAKGAVA